MSTQPGLTYAEVRWWACELGVFTAGDLADAMGVDYEVGRRSVAALCHQGVCHDTGSVIDGRHGYEYIIEYVELPAGPAEHETGISPEAIALREFRPLPTPPRGMPVRIRTERMMRRSLSTPGARQHHKNRERNYQRIQDARARRQLEQAIADRRKAQGKPAPVAKKQASTKTSAFKKKKANRKK